MPSRRPGVIRERARFALLAFQAARLRPTPDRPDEENGGVCSGVQLALYGALSILE